MKSDEFDQLKALIQSEVGGVRSEVTGLRTEMGEVRSDVTGLRSEVGDLRSEVAGANTEYAGLIGLLSKKFDRMDARFTRLEVGQEDLGGKLAVVGGGVTSNGERLGRIDERIDGVDGLVRELAGLKPSSARPGPARR